MLYISTRGKSAPVTGAEAIVMGIAPDGGLMVPERMPRLSRDDMASLNTMDYSKRAAFIIGKFLPDWPEDFLKGSCDLAYSQEKFGNPHVAPVADITDKVSILELWHGPTCAFKDMALQMLPHLMAQGVRMTGHEGEIVILVATSGDTGKAALEGFKDVPGTRIIVFYPANGVSEIQRLQMVSQEGKNVAVVAVEGNFDDAQTGVKEIFADGALACEMQEKGFRFSSANSINWGRLVPQIVYYISSYLELVKRGRIGYGEQVNFVVPTGNFGNILAGYYAKEMGLPIKRLICASNENNVLTDFIRTGIYDRRRDLHQTISPSMDILVSSNLERLLFELTDRDSSKVRQWMRQLREEGHYQVDAKTLDRLQSLFYGDFVRDDEAMESIKDIYYKYGYLIDTHTAVGTTVCGRYQPHDKLHTVVVSTASPFKFNKSVAQALLGAEAIEGMDEFQLIDKVSDFTGLKVPKGLNDLDKKPILHNLTCSRREMKEQVSSLLYKSQK
jgi:threonine synthase